MIALKTVHILKVLIMGMLGCVMLPETAASADPVPAGSLTAVRGTVQIRRPGSVDPFGVREHADYFVGDRLETGADGFAQLTLRDGAYVDLGSDAAIRINQYSYDETTKRRALRARLLKGAARHVLFLATGADSTFVIETEQAAVVPSMLADFVVSGRDVETVVVVLDGTVRTKNASPYVIGEVRVPKNSRTQISRNKPPLPPIVITAKERKDYLIEVGAR